MGVSGEGAVAEFVRRGLAFAAEMIFFREACFCKAHQLVEDCEFKLEFDGVDHRFDCCFADIVICEFETDKDDVHANTNAIDCE